MAKQSLRLPTAGATQFGVSSIIVADRVGVRDTPYSALDQRGHPYAIGLTEIVPASDSLFTRDERLSVAFQVVNPSADAGGKPDVSAALRILRLVGPREETAAALTPLRYDATTLPEDFDVRLGHPLLAAMSAPLATLPRGTYRLEVTVTDHLSGIAARAVTHRLSHRRDTTVAPGRGSGPGAGLRSRHDVRNSHARCGGRRD